MGFHSSIANYVYHLFCVFGVLYLACNKSISLALQSVALQLFSVAFNLNALSITRVEWGSPSHSVSGRAWYTCLYLRVCLFRSPGTQEPVPCILVLSNIRPTRSALTYTVPESSKTSTCAHAPCSQLSCYTLSRTSRRKIHSDGIALVCVFERTSILTSHFM